MVLGVSPTARLKRGEKAGRVNFVPARDMSVGGGADKGGQGVKIALANPKLSPSSSLVIRSRRRKRRRVANAGGGSVHRRVSTDRPAGYLLMPPYTLVCIPILRLTYGLIGPTRALPYPIWDPAQARWHMGADAVGGRSRDQGSYSPGTRASATLSQSGKHRPSVDLDKT